MLHYFSQMYIMFETATRDNIAPYMEITVYRFIALFQVFTAIEAAEIIQDTINETEG